MKSPGSTAVARFGKATGMIGPTILVHTARSLLGPPAWENSAFA
ncbi:hypothetical protein [Notoacmeibacter marinus]|nr:hypothetical protein [Notoacmeibacter marinus]